MLPKEEIHRIIKEALKIRIKEKIAIDNSFCVIDLTAKLGVEVRFVDFLGIEGAYIRDSEKILLSTLRPEGRIRFTCAHELAHYIFNHGDNFDELVENFNNSENHINEKISDIFASFILMPETTVRSGFISRNWDFTKPGPIEIYTIASWLGVGYTTLVNHMHFSLRLIGINDYKDLLKVKPKIIKKNICGFDINSNLIILDEHWKGAYSG